MDDIVLLVIGAIILLVILVLYILISANAKPDSSASKQTVKTKKEKRAEILAQYKEELIEELKPLQHDKEALLKKKAVVLKRFSNELSRNIFFDNDEVKEIILELTKVS